MRYLTIPFILTSLLAFDGPCLAGDVPMHKHSADELKNVCTKLGGSFSQDAAHYGCGTDCHGAHGTDCIVSCTSKDQLCVAQVIGGRRPRTLEAALQVPERKRR